MVGIDSVSLAWHSRQTLVTVSPRIVVIPGGGKGVEQPEQVGINVLEEVSTRLKGKDLRAYDELNKHTLVAYRPRHILPGPRIQL